VEPQVIEAALRCSFITALSRFTALVICFAVCAHSQSMTGTLVGTVVNGNGLPLSGVTVRLTGHPAASRIQVATDARGEFQFVLPYGEYEISADSAGIQPSCELSRRAGSRDAGICIGRSATRNRRRPHRTACGSRSPGWRRPSHPAAGHRSAFPRERTACTGASSTRFALTRPAKVVHLFHLFSGELRVLDRPSLAVAARCPAHRAN